jgi:hypothetical protein
MSTMTAALTAMAVLVSVDTYITLIVAVVVLCAAPLVLAPMIGTPLAGLSGLLVIAVLLPMEWTIGPLASIGASAPLAVAVCGVALIRLLGRNRAPASRSSVALATLALMVVASFSFIWGQYPWLPASPAPLPAQIGGLGIFLLSGGLLLVVGRTVTTLAQLQRLTWVFIASGSAAVVLVTTAELTPLPLGNAVVTPESLGSAFWVWLTSLALGQALVNDHLSKGTRIALLLVSGLTLFRGLALAFSWVSGWLPPLVAVAVILLLRYPRTIIGFAVLALAPALAIGGIAFGELMVGENYSWMTRAEALSVMGQLIEHSPLLGFGPANYYHYTLLFPILGWYVNFSSHNNYVDIVAQVGLVGLFAFAWLTVSALYVGIRQWSRAGRDFTGAYLAGAVGGIAGTLVSGLLADWFLPFVYNIGFRGFRSSLLFWVFLGGLVALDRMMRTTMKGSTRV